MWPLEVDILIRFDVSTYKPYYLQTFFEKYVYSEPSSQKANACLLSTKQLIVLGYDTLEGSI